MAVVLNLPLTGTAKNSPHTKRIRTSAFQKFSGTFPTLTGQRYVQRLVYLIIAPFWRQVKPMENIFPIEVNERALQEFSEYSDN